MDQGNISSPNAAEHGLMYRAFTPDLDIKPGGDGRTVHGIAVPYGQVQRIDDHLTEEFVRGAFDHQMAAIHRVGFYYPHSRDGGALLGRQTVGRDDAAGLYGEWRVSKTRDGDDALELINDGALSQLSIGFRAAAGGSRSVHGVTQRTKAHLFEVAIVPEGAYGDGAAITGVRSADSNGMCSMCGQTWPAPDEPEPAPMSRARLEQAATILAGMNLPTIGA
jgi:HK97 family phage prohead protease